MSSNQSNLLAQLAAERNARNSQQLEAFREKQKYIEKFKTFFINKLEGGKYHKRLLRDLAEVNSNISESFQEDFQPILNKINNHIRYLSKSNIDSAELLSHLDRFLVYINDVRKIKEHTIELLTESHQELLPLAGKKTKFMNLFAQDMGSNEKEALSLLEKAETLLLTHADKFKENIDREISILADKIYQYFVAFEQRGLQHVFAVFVFKPKYERLAESYKQTFNKELGVCLEWDMAIENDMSVAIYEQEKELVSQMAKDRALAEKLSNSPMYAV